MRILCLLLLTANLGFWAWVNWIRAAPAPVSRYDEPGITLFGELPATSPLRALPPAAPEGFHPAAGNAAPAEAQRCIVVGPFVEAAAADDAQVILAEAGIPVNRFVGEDEIWDGYWVYIERIASRERAREMLDMLAAVGIDDAYMIPDSDRGILISLGVFSEISRAGVLAGRVAELELELEATIGDRLRLAETTWLQMEVAEGTDVLARLTPPGRISRLEQLSCEPGSD